VLSIITPIFNKRKTLPRIIDSVADLSRLVPCELILIDDKSTDGATEYIQSACSQFIDLKKVFLKKNSGPGVARNAGLNVARHKYVTFLDGDDEIAVEGGRHRSNAASLLSLLDSSVDIVRLQHNKWKRSTTSESWTTANQEIHAIALGRNPGILSEIEMVECWGYLIRRELITNNKIRFLETRIAEDQPFIVEVFLNAESYSETRVLNYLHTPNSTGAATRIQETCAGDHLQAIEHISRLKVQAPNRRKEFLENKIRFLKKYLPWYCLPYLQDEDWLDRKVVLDRVLQDVVLIGDKENIDNNAGPTDIMRVLSERYLQFGRQSSKRIYLYGLSVIAISLVELFKKNDLTIHCIVDDCPSSEFLGPELV
jgi:glycosyltransferase involved in cell wall biosynthesis